MIQKDLTGDAITITMKGEAEGNIASAKFDGDGMNLTDIKIIEEGKAINQSAFEAGLDDEDVRTWLKYGEEGKEPYIEFYQDYKEALDK